MIRVETDDHISTITLDRPEKPNAMTPEMSGDLARSVAELNADDACRVVVLTGGRKVFCAGSDIRSLDEYPQPWDYQVRVDDYTRSVHRLRKPAIAMISGYCLGGGLEMAVNADTRYASTDAVFGGPEARWGWIGGGGNWQILPRLIGFGRAMELLLTGRSIDAATALRIGLVEQVTPPEDLEATTYDLAREIAAHAPIAAQVIKQAIRMSMNIGVESGLEYENELVHLTYSTEDKAEGVRAFKEKRQPRFTGR